MSEHFITFQQIQKRTVTKKVKITLLHCPLCGGEAEFRVGGNYDPKQEKRVGVGVRCKDCKLVSPVRQGGESYQNAAEIWNRRVVG